MQRMQWIQNRQKNVRIANNAKKRRMSTMRNIQRNRRMQTIERNQKVRKCNKTAKNAMNAKKATLPEVDKIGISVKTAMLARNQKCKERRDCRGCKSSKE